MQRKSCRRHVCAAIAVLGLTGLAIGCTDSAAPVGPAGTGAVPAASAAGRPVEFPANHAFPVTPGLLSLSQASAAHPNPTELASRGWNCFTPPVPNRIVCSRPNQGFPTVGFPPPEDRPATFTFWLFDGTGSFTGTELLIRTDLYKGQLCESTRQPYVFVPFIGYYECIHTPGR